MTTDQQKTLELLRLEYNRVKLLSITTSGMPIVRADGNYFALTPKRDEQSKKNPGTLKVNR